MTATRTSRAAGSFALHARMPWPLLAVASLAMFTVAASGTTRAPFLIEMARDLSTNVPLIADLVAISSLSWGVTSVIAGAGSDRWGTRPFLLAGPLGLAVATTGIATGGSFAAVAAWVTLAGAFCGLFSGVIFAEVSSRVSPTQQGRALGWVMSGQSLTLLIGVPLAAWVGSWIGWRGVNLCIAALALITAASLLAVTVRRANVDPVAAARVPSMRAALSRPVLRLLAMGIAERICYGLVAVYYATFLQSTYSLSLQGVALPLGIFAIGNIFGTLLGGQLADRLRNRLAIFGAAMLASGVAALALFGWQTECADLGGAGLRLRVLQCDCTAFADGIAQRRAGTREGHGDGSERHIQQHRLAGCRRSWRVDDRQLRLCRLRAARRDGGGDRWRARAARPSLTGCPANRQSPSADWAAVFAHRCRNVVAARHKTCKVFVDEKSDRGRRMRQDGVLAGYDPGSLFCEMLRPGEAPHSALSLLRERLRLLPVESLRRRAAEAERDLLERGITFTVYSDATAIDRILPFDLIPRVITAQEWRTLEAGVIQRVRALNLFLHDIYHERKILADGVVPRELVLGNAAYCEAMIGFDPPHGTYVHICGTDIIRDDTGRFLVLEDNARTPSGVAYVVENRHMSLRVLSDLMAGLRVRSVDEYGLQLHRAMTEIAPAGVSDPQVVLLSPGIFNSAYFEHVFLAREMGVPLVEGQDLLVEDGRSGCAPRPASRGCTRSIGG